jgi:hypothetical protein
MQRFIIQQNIDHYRRLLTTETNPARRQMVLKLLAEEEQIWAGLNASTESEKPDETQAQSRAIGQIPDAASDSPGSRRPT